MHDVIMNCRRVQKRNPQRINPKLHLCPRLKMPVADRHDRTDPIFRNCRRTMPGKQRHLPA